MKRQTLRIEATDMDRRHTLIDVACACLPWLGILVLTGALFLTLPQLGLVLLFCVPVLWLYGRERVCRRAFINQRNDCEKRLGCILGALAEGVMVLDGQGYLDAVNPFAENLLEYETGELTRQLVEVIVPTTFARTHEASLTGMVQRCLMQGVGVQAQELPLLSRSGLEIPVLLSLAPIEEKGAMAGAVITFQGLSEKKELENKLKMMATRDAVTGVRNRWETERQLSIEVARARRHKRALSVFMVNIDHFKRINDTYGPHNGNTVLRAACDTMTGMMRASDIVGRFGGEAFMAVLPETELENALILAHRLREAIAADAVPLDHGRSAFFTISIGAAAFPASGQSADALIQAADLALYKAKSMGFDCVVADRQSVS